MTDVGDCSMGNGVSGFVGFLVGVCGCVGELRVCCFIDVWIE